MMLQRGLLIASVLLLGASCMPSAKAFDLEALEQIIASGAETPEQIIDALPEDFRGNAAYIYQSRSIQASSPSHPRALLWDEQTGFTLAFNGDSSLKGYKSLEMANIDRESGQIHFYEIEFPLKRNREGRAELEGNLREPGLCLACHGQNARPIWHSFPNWPGAYGGFNDLVEGDELSDFESFREVASNDPRYHSLKLPQLASDLEAQGTPIGLENRPNMRFGALLSRMNAFRIRKLLETNDANQRREIMGIFAGCSSKQGAEADQDLQERSTQFLGSIGLTLADLDMNFDHDDPSNEHLDFLTSYVDGFSTTRELVTYQLFKDWMPDFQPGFQTDDSATTIANFQNSLRQPDDAATPFVQNLDSWGPWVQLDLESTHSALCGALGSFE